MQKEHVERMGLGWEEDKAQRSAQEAYWRMFTFRWTPPGRGIQVMGTANVKRRRAAALNNCAFHTTAGIDRDFAEPFCYMMDMSMLGVGVGFDVDGAGKVQISTPFGKTQKLVIPDNREGWVDSLRLLLLSFTATEREVVIRDVDKKLQPQSIFLPAPIEFDYSAIRKKGELVRGFMAEASGPGPLMEMHEGIRAILTPLNGKPITRRAIADVMNMIGRCVVSGNIRRSAQIMLGPSGDAEFLDLKNWTLPENRARMGKGINDNGEIIDVGDGWGWASNNSLRADLGMNYNEVVKRIRINGEPGLFWMENVQRYGRLCDPALPGTRVRPDRATGINPCGEQPLENSELCTLTETYPAQHESLEDFLRTLKYAYMYAKTVTLTNTHWTSANRVMMRNRRIGLSMSGIAQFVSGRGMAEYVQWCRRGYETVRYYDEVYSDWLAIPQSIRVTTVKPSGTVSLLAGATPGIHYSVGGRYYIRRVGVAADSPLVTAAKEAGYAIEVSAHYPNMVNVLFPVDEGKGVRAQADVPMLEQLELAAATQYHWSDNAVSCTVSFNEKEEGPLIEDALDDYQYRLKSISFLPRKADEPTYTQAPYQPITANQYEEMVKGLKPLRVAGYGGEGMLEKFCTNDGACALPTRVA